MFCTKCERSNADEAVDCASCGAPTQEPTGAAAEDSASTSLSDTPQTAQSAQDIQDAQSSARNAQDDACERAEPPLDDAQQHCPSNSKKSPVGIAVAVIVVLLTLTFGVLTTVIYHHINDSESGSETVTTESSSGIQR